MKDDSLSRCGFGYTAFLCPAKEVKRLRAANAEYITLAAEAVEFARADLLREVRERINEIPVYTPAVGDYRAEAMRAIDRLDNKEASK